MSKLLIAAATFVFGLLFASAAMAQATVFGIWVDEGGLSHIEIFDCRGQICGKFIWFEEPNEEDGTPKLDDENPDEAMRTRPLMGLQLLEGFDASGPTAWGGGTIYDPQSGKTYSSTMELLDDNTIEVRGYVVLPIFGRSQTWTRYIP